jgi:AcrR family transcriptional regulator
MAQRQDVDDGIADATLALLRTKGPRSVTVEAVAARSGIAKTTIYRRHRDRRDMLSAALSRVTTPEPLAAQADAPDRLRWLIKEAVKTIEAGIGYGGLAAMLTDEDPDFTKLFRRILAKQRTELESAIDAGRADGSFRRCRRRDTRRRRGRCAYRRARPHGAVAAGWESRLFDLFWPIVRA